MQHNIETNEITPPSSGQKPFSLRAMAMTGFGLGFAPVASGTFGSAGAVVIAMVVWFLAGSPMVFDLTLVGLTALACIGCVYWGVWAVAEYGATARKEGDPGKVVLDEFAGQWISLVALPLVGFQHMVLVMALQFFLFRFFDVAKLAPARQLERLPAGWGILLDDCAAGVYANLVGQIVVRYFWPGFLP